MKWHSRVFETQVVATNLDVVFCRIMLDSASTETLCIESGLPQLFFFVIINVGVKLGPVVPTDQQFGMFLQRN